MENARKACGAHSALAREVHSLHVVLTRLQAEAASPESILNGGGASTENGRGRAEKGKELADLVTDCERVLRVLKEILEKVCITFSVGTKRKCETNLWLDSITHCQTKNEVYRSFGKRLNSAMVKCKTWIKSGLNLRQYTSHHTIFKSCIIG